MTVPWVRCTPRCILIYSTAMGATQTQTQALPSRSTCANPIPPTLKGTRRAKARVCRHAHRHASFVPHQQNSDSDLAHYEIAQCHLRMSCRTLASWPRTFGGVTCSYRYQHLSSSMSCDKNLISYGRNRQIMLKWQPGRKQPCV